jgi:hypothetical protein
MGVGELGGDAGGGCAGSAGCCARLAGTANGETKQRPLKRVAQSQPRRASIQCINGKTTQEFREKVSGFLRHYLAGEGNLPELGQRDRIHQE